MRGESPRRDTSRESEIDNLSQGYSSHSKQGHNGRALLLFFLSFFFSSSEH